MAELRYNPLLNTYTMVAGNRQNRPHLPKDYCPFCTSSGKVPNEYEMLVYDNDFPVLSLAPEKVANKNKDFFIAKDAYGKCEVILYSHLHHQHLYQLQLSQIEKLVEVWKQRTEELCLYKNIQYIFPFENRGEEVGVTIHHPHGQLYAYSWVPAKIETELQNCEKYFQQNNTNLFTHLIHAEVEANKRIIFENDSFICLLPYFTDYPYGVFIIAKKNIVSLLEFSTIEKKELAQCIKNITGAFEYLFQKQFHYMMCVHHASFNNETFKNQNLYYRFHIEFYPPLRASDKIKWMASSETGAGAAANPRLVEETALELQSALKEFLKSEFA
jgi:UDPglucose--hexose-1-phosphate uridylyltransferase